jgi:hypothetical protein
VPPPPCGFTHGRTPSTLRLHRATYAVQVPSASSPRLPLSWRSSCQPQESNARPFALESFRLLRGAYLCLKRSDAAGRSGRSGSSTGPTSNCLRGTSWYWAGSRPRKSRPCPRIELRLLVRAITCPGSFAWSCLCLTKPCAAPGTYEASTLRLACWGLLHIRGR